MSDDHVALQARVPEEEIGQRVDQVAAVLFSAFSRSQLQQWIKKGCLLMDGECCKPKDKVLGGEVLTLRAELESQGDWVAEDIPLDVVFEDDEIVVINKPAGLVVHPGAGNREGTLLNALLHRYPRQESIPRAGIVHRLDKETSGLMVVARTLQAQTSLVEQLQARSVSRQYDAVVVGVPVGGRTIEEPIGRHPTARTRMAVAKQGGKPAVTHFRVRRKFAHHALVRVKLETGRTHQIRVHMAHIGCPLVGDPVYGGRFKLPPGASETLIETLRQFRRQALHAAYLSFAHPRTGETLVWEANLPEDMVELLAALEAG